MALQDKYINPFTDFGFKKLFETTDITLFRSDEKLNYEESLKYYRDLKNVIDTSFVEGKLEGKLEIAVQMKRKGMDINLIAEITGLSPAEIDKA